MNEVARSTTRPRKLMRAADASEHRLAHWRLCLTTVNQVGYRMEKMTHVDCESGHCPRCKAEAEFVEAMRGLEGENKVDDGAGETNEAIQQLEELQTEDAIEIVRELTRHEVYGDLFSLVEEIRQGQLQGEVPRIAQMSTLYRMNTRVISRREPAKEAESAT